MSRPLPRISLSDLSLAAVNRERFRDVVTQAAADDRISCRVKTTESGYSDLRLAIELLPETSSCFEFTNQYLSATRHEWPETQVYAVNQPVYVLPNSGVVITEAGQIISETIYPSSGDQSEERIIGADLTEETWSRFLSECETLADRWWTPLLPRWSNVYFHAVTEGLVQQSIYRGLGVEESLSYFAPATLTGSQTLIASKAREACHLTGAPLVKAPRLVICDDLYQHAIMGPSFNCFADETHLNSVRASQNPSHRHIYVSRRLAETRRMRNEAALIEALAALGFHIVEAEQLSFDEQLDLFSQAKVIMGPHGAGLVNAAFASPDCILFELRPLNRAGESPYWGASYRKLASVRKMPYFSHVSENEYGMDDWDADIATILKVATIAIHERRRPF